MLQSWAGICPPCPAHAHHWHRGRCFARQSPAYSLPAWWHSEQHPCSGRSSALCLGVFRAAVAMGAVSSRLHCCLPRHLPVLLLPCLVQHLVTRLKSTWNSL